MLTDRQIDTQTDRETDRNTPLRYRGGVNMKNSTFTHTLIHLVTTKYISQTANASVLCNQETKNHIKKMET